MTGADGFIGSHVAEALVRAGHEVSALAQYRSDGSHGWLDSIQPNVRDSVSFVQGDVRDSDQMLTQIRGHDAVLHLAALVGIPYSYIAPRSYLQTNVEGTLNICEAARRHGSRMIHTSTSEVYGTPATLPITEQHPLIAQSPYSASKIAADKLVESFALSFELPFHILRPFNTFGPRQSQRAVISSILTQLLLGDGTLRVGSVTPRRDFTYVADTADAYLRLLQTELPPATTVQLGTGHDVSIEDLISLCGEVVGVVPRVLQSNERVRPAKSEVQVLQSDPTLAHDLIGWSAQTSLMSGLAKVAEWIQATDPADNSLEYRI